MRINTSFAVPQEIGEVIGKIMSNTGMCGYDVRPKSIRLGKINTTAITAETPILRDEHFPCGEAFYRETMLGFLSALPKIEKGVERFCSVTNDKDILLEDFIGQYIRKEIFSLQENRFSLPYGKVFYGEIASNSRRMLTSLGGSLRDDGSDKIRVKRNHFIEETSLESVQKDNVMKDLGMGIEMLGKNSGVRLMGLKPKDANEITRFGMFNIYDLNRLNWSASDFSGASYADLNHAGLNYFLRDHFAVSNLYLNKEGNFSVAVENIGGSPFCGGWFSYQPDKLEYVTITSAPDPIIEEIGG